MHLLGRPRPVDARLVVLELRRVGRKLAILLHAVERALTERREHFHHEFRTETRQRVVQLARRHVGADGKALHKANRTFVEPFRYAHDRDAGLRIARHDGAVDGRRTAPARQQGGVNIENAAAGAVQNQFR